MGDLLRAIGRLFLGGPAEERDAADLNLRADSHGGSLLREVLPVEKLVALRAATSS